MPELSDSKYLVTCGWSEVPHLDEKTMAEMMASTPPYQRDARSKGTPSLGAGAIYPIEEERIKVQPFQIPPFWKKAYALDVGWNRTAALWGAEDPQTGTCYLYSEYYAGLLPPSTHTVAINARGKWIPGVIDPASSGSSQHDGTVLMESYRQLGLNLMPADNAVEAGLYDVWQMLESGRLKIFASLLNWFGEYRLYRRSENGKIVKKNDHLMDCLTGDTMVETRDGAIAIADMPETGEVRTPLGYARYTHCQRYGENRPLVRLKFSDGSSVRCTPDHRFQTKDGWVAAIDLAGMLCDTRDVSRNISGADQCPSSSSFPLRSKSFRGSDITSAVNISSAMGSGCTLRSGRISMVDVPLKASTFTMAMRIVQTISRIISHCSNTGFTSRIIRRGMADRLLLLHWSERRNGMDRLKAKHGTGATTKALLLRCMFALSDRAINVVSATMRQQKKLFDSVRMVAKLNIEMLLVSTTSNAVARLTGSHFASTNTGKPQPAPYPAELRCVSVEPFGRGDVYCLTVPSEGAFVLANGVVTHNCTRYYIRSGRGVAKVKPVPIQAIANVGFGDDRMGY